MRAIPSDPQTPAEIDQQIVRLARQQGALDEEIGRWLLLAARSRLHRHFGMASFVEYVERRLGCSPRLAKDKARVATALEDLPQLKESLISGELSWSATKELVRVAKPASESAWIEAARGKTIREVEKMVRGRRLGDTPRAPADPLLEKTRVVLDFTAEELAIWKEAQARARKAGDPRRSDAEVAVAMAEALLGKARKLEDEPAYQVGLTVCVDCQCTVRHADGEAIEVPESVCACAECDGEVVGLVESPALAPFLTDGSATNAVESTHMGQAVMSDDVAALHRLVRRGGIPRVLRETSKALGWRHRAITPKMRKLVLARDQYRCVVPGCCSNLFVEIHHLTRIEDGGANNPENLIVLCAAHHRLFHEGYLAITKTPSTGLTFRTQGGTLYGQIPKRSAA